MNVTCNDCDERARSYIEVPGPHRTTIIRHFCLKDLKAFVEHLDPPRARVSRSSPARKE